MAPKFFVIFRTVSTSSQINQGLFTHLNLVSNVSLNTIQNDIIYDHHYRCSDKSYNESLIKAITEKLFFGTKMFILTLHNFCCIVFFIFHVDCSQRRAALYFVESINSEAFIGRKCNTYFCYLLGWCANNEKAVIGEGSPSNIAGKYYLKTNKESPFGKGESGA